MLTQCTHPSGFVHLTHQNLSTRALFCHNSLAKVNMQLLIYKQVCVCLHLAEISPHELVTRLNITLFGFEYHCFNRSSLYSNIQKAFGLEPTLIPESSSFASSGSGGIGGGSTTSGTASGEKGSGTK